MLIFVAASVGRAALEGARVKAFAASLGLGGGLWIIIPWPANRLDATP